MKAINLFNQWVELGKDDGMEVNHTPSVDYMISLIPNNMMQSDFSFLDLGCGNGWLVRKMSSIKTCVNAVGIDGSENMIKKAILYDSNSEYIKCDLNQITSYNQHFNIVFSMEVLYYLKNPQNTIKYIYNHLIKDGGCFVMGVDHYLENQPSLKWPLDLQVNMLTYSMLEWENMLKNAGFSNVKVSQYGQEKEWSGTLVLYGEK